MTRKPANFLMIAALGMATMTLSAGCGSIGEVFFSALKQAAVEEIQAAAVDLTSQLGDDLIAGLIPTTQPALTDDSDQ